MSEGVQVRLLVAAKEIYGACRNLDVVILQKIRYRSVCADIQYTNG